jgi:hypothetical protein
VRPITETEDSPAICANIVVDDPAFAFVISAFVLWCVTLLVERIVDTFFEDFIGILWSRWTLWTRLCVR